MTTTVENVIKIAKAEVGYHEGYSNGHWNNKEKYAAQVPGLAWADYQAWCATFVSYCFYKAGLAKDAFLITASVAAARDWAKKNGRFSEYPAIGAMALFGTSGSEHTGIVYAYDKDYIYTVEGNTNDNGSAEGDGVYLKKRERRSSHTYGYLYPKYPEGIVSADPAWKNEAPKPTEPKPEPSKPAPKPKPTKPLVPAFPGRKYFKVGANNKYVTQLDKLLVKTGFTKHKDGKAYEPGPQYTTYTRDNVKDFQKSMGWSGSDADGLVGPETWKQLHLKAGYRV